MYQPLKFVPTGRYVSKQTILCNRPLYIQNGTALAPLIRSKFRL